MTKNYQVDVYGNFLTILDSVVCFVAGADAVGAGDCGGGGIVFLYFWHVFVVVADSYAAMLPDFPFGMACCCIAVKAIVRYIAFVVGVAYFLYCALV